MSEAIAGRETDERVHRLLGRSPSEWSPAPRYTTDIGAAWLLWEEARDLRLPTLTDCGGFGYRCVLSTTSPDAESVEATADTAPLAITRAWLAATAVDCA